MTGPDDSVLLRTDDDGVLTLRFNRPAARNALNRRLRAELWTALHEASVDPGVRVVVLAGDRRAFCAGGDVKEMGGGAADAAAKLTLAKQIIQLVADMPKPVVAAVRGHAAGAGFSLALACDLVVVDPTAVFRFAFIERALVPDMSGTYWLARQVGLHRAKDIALTGRPVTAQEAYRLGIAARLWPEEEYDQGLRALVRALADSPAQALGLTKRLLNRTFESDLGAAMDAEMLAQSIASSSAEHLRGLRSTR